jgi:hypothetical protein
VFLDISKTFDKVWHEGLISKLKFIGIKGTLLKWLESYLSNRFQRVVVEGTNSKKSKWKGKSQCWSTPSQCSWATPVSDLHEQYY